MFQQIEKRIQQAVAGYLQARYGESAPVQTEQPKQASFGELALPVAFQLARQLRRAPRAIAQDLVAGLGAIEGIAALEVAGNGYINVRLDRGWYGAALVRGQRDQAETCYVRYGDWFAWGCAPLACAALLLGRVRRRPARR